MSKKTTKIKEKNNKGGREAVVLSDTQIKKLEKLSANMTIAQIADYFNIGESTFYELKNRDPRVSGAYKKGKATGIENATNLLWQKMKEGDTTSIIFYLKTQAGWSEKQFIETKDVTPKQPPNRIFYVNEKPEHRKND